MASFQGSQGNPGVDEAQLALKADKLTTYTKTETDTLLTSSGQQGPKGDKGDTGEAGPQGVPGANGIETSQTISVTNLIMQEFERRTTPVGQYLRTGAERGYLANASGYVTDRVLPDVQSNIINTTVSSTGVFPSSSYSNGVITISKHCYGTLTIVGTAVNTTGGAESGLNAQRHKLFSQIVDPVYGTTTTGLINLFAGSSGTTYGTINNSIKRHFSAGATFRIYATYSGESMFSLTAITYGGTGGFKVTFDAFAA